LIGAGEEWQSSEQRTSVGAETKIAIVVNGEPVSTAAATLHDLIAERGLAGARVATARNGDFVPARAWPATALSVGDHIEILSPRHGG
jgi:sulfur carrier protein